MVFLGKSNSKHQNPRETTIVKIVGIDPNGSTDWLHRNYSYQHHKIDNDKVSIQMPAIFTIGVSLGV